MYLVERCRHVIRRGAASLSADGGTGRARRSRGLLSALARLAARPLVSGLDAHGGLRLWLCSTAGTTSARLGSGLDNRFRLRPHAASDRARQQLFLTPPPRRLCFPPQLPIAAASTSTAVPARLRTPAFRDLGPPAQPSLLPLLELRLCRKVIVAGCPPSGSGPLAGRHLFANSCPFRLGHPDRLGRRSSRGVTPRGRRASPGAVSSRIAASARGSAASGSSRDSDPRAVSASAKSSSRDAPSTPARPLGLGIGSWSSQWSSLSADASRSQLGRVLRPSWCTPGLATRASAPTSGGGGPCGLQEVDPGPKRRDLATRLAECKERLAIALGEVAELGQQLAEGRCLGLGLAS